MATSKEFIDYFKEQMAPVGDVFCRKMFGDYGIYCDGVFFALVCDDQFFVKVTLAGEQILGENYPTGLPFKGAKTPMFLVADFEDLELMRELVWATCDELVAKKAKSSK